MADFHTGTVHVACWILHRNHPYFATHRYLDLERLVVSGRSFVVGFLSESLSYETFETISAIK